MEGKQLGYFGEVGGKNHEKVLLKLSYERKEVPVMDNSIHNSENALRSEHEYNESSMLATRIDGIIRKRSSSLTAQNEDRFLQQSKCSEQSNNPVQNNQNIAIIMDSNRRDINFNKLFPNAKVNIYPCGTAKWARKLVEETDFKNPSDVIFHLGTNDLETLSPSHFVEDIKQVASIVETKYKCKVFISEILPRGDTFHEKVATTNRLLKQLPWHLVSHDKISPEHLHDTKHLNRFVKQNDVFSGSQLLSIDFYQTMYNKVPHKTRLTYFNYPTKKIHSKRHRYVDDFKHHNHYNNQQTLV